MRTLTLRYCFAAAMSIGFVGTAHADAVADVFHEFSACDASFFRALARESETWQSMVRLEKVGTHARIPVANRNDDSENHTDFSNPPSLSGTKLLSYIDEVSDLGDMGLYYYWGFTVPGQVEDVARSLLPLIHDGARLRRDGPVYVRTEVKVAGSRWLPLATHSNTPAGLLRIERVFLIEAQDQPKNTVRVSCSLQGAVTADVLKEIRPDIEAKDYPKQLSPVLFDDVKVPDNVLLSTRRADWAPRFKKLSYTIRTKKEDSSKVSVTTVEMQSRDGLVLVKEDYGVFTVERLMLADLVQLKSRMSGIGDSRVLLTTSLELSLPTLSERGGVLNLSAVMAEQPPKPGDREQRTRLTCNVLNEIGADSIFAALTGQARMLSCTSDSSDETSTRAYLEDLGIAIPLASKSASGNFTNEFTRFVVER